MSQSLPSQKQAFTWLSRDNNCPSKSVGFQAGVHTVQLGTLGENNNELSPRLGGDWGWDAGAVCAHSLLQGDVCLLGEKGLFKEGHMSNISVA